MASLRVPFVKRVGKQGEFSLPPDVISAVGIVEKDLVEFQVLRIVKPPPRKAEPPDAASPMAARRLDP